MTKPIAVKKILQYVFFIGIAFLFFWLAMRKVDFFKMMSYVKKASLWPLFFVFIGGGLSHLLRGIRWKMLIEPLGYKPRLVNTFLSVMIGYLVNLATPRMGEIARCAVLSKYEKIPADKLAGTMLVERLFDVICLLIVLFLTYFVEYKMVNEYMQNKIFAPLSMFFTFKKIVFTFLILFAFLLLVLFLRKKTKSSTNKFSNIINNLANGFLSFRKVKNPIGFIACSAGIWFLYWFMTYMGLLAFKELSALSFGTALSILAIGSIGFIIPAPGGLGSFQYFVQSTLENIYAINENLSAAYANVSWFAQTLILMVGGFVALILIPFVNNKNR